MIDYFSKTRVVVSDTGSGLEFYLPTIQVERVEMLFLKHHVHIAVEPQMADECVIKIMDDTFKIDVIQNILDSVE